MTQELPEEIAAAHGYDDDNYVGELVQHNPWSADGSRFFIENRVLPYLEADLSMIGLYGRVPPAFWETYARLSKISPRDGEWMRRIKWFDIKEHLAHRSGLRFVAQLRDLDSGKVYFLATTATNALVVE